MTSEEILQYDKKHLWHPYSSIINSPSVYCVQSAEGVRLQLEDGRELVDGMASWWSVIHGYGHPDLVQTVQRQAAKLSHVMFGGLTHEPAVQLARTLVELTPEPLDLVFFADSGSVAVEVAMKMAIQYQHASGKSEKQRFLTIRSGYHGDVFHCMSVCDPVNGMHQLFSRVLPKYYFAEKPECNFTDKWDQEDISSFEYLIRLHHHELSAVILEPIVQGAGGMRFYHPEYLRCVRKLCDKYDVLLIADEIATGFGRSGKMFACEHADISPDILCLGKALTGGMMTLAAVVATREIGERISSAEPGLFMHGPTFMANPLACAVANSSIRLLLEMNWKKRVQQIEKILIRELKPCNQFSSVADVRVLGAIGAVELTKPVDMAVIQPAFVAKGVWVRPFGKLVYVMPAYCIKEQDLQKICTAIRQVIEEECG